MDEFIKRRFPTPDKWETGNCFWFALILEKRFPGGSIYYVPIEGHFIYKYNDKFYGWSGEYDIKDKEVISLTKLKIIDELWYNRLMRDCFE